MLFNKVQTFFPKMLKISDARQQIRSLNEEMGTLIVVLDDDPTGCQTVQNVKVLTQWDKNLLQKTAAGNTCFYILTNSRAYNERYTMKINKEIVQNLVHLFGKKSLRIISRSDSTLRGHFHAELKTLIQKAGPFDGVLIVPYFKEGGRFTFHDTHYVLQKDRLIPAHKTEFAQDPVFGFSNSYLPLWIEEKSRGLWKRNDVRSISIEDIRIGGPEYVMNILLQAENNIPIVVNSLCDEDLEIVILGLLNAEIKGKKFLYRTAASFVKIRAGIKDHSLFKPSHKFRKGLVVVGSYVGITTRQLENLLNNTNLPRIELKIQNILSNKRIQYLKSIRHKIDETLMSNESVVIFTERNYALSGSISKRLREGARISEFIARVVGSISVDPDFVVAKGGITSFDVAKNGLRTKEATVLGQIIPGVPIWQLGHDSVFPNILYVVFPGNVGDDNSLYEAFSRLSSFEDISNSYRRKRKSECKQESS